MTQAITSFFLDQGFDQDGGTLAYRPFGTRSLKIKLSTEVDLPPLTIKPEGAAGGDDKIYVLTGDDQAFQVSWGGGHEGGSPAATKDVAKAFEKSIKVKGGGKPKFLYFNVRHWGDSLPEQTPITIGAYRKDGTRQAAVTVQLLKPDDYDDDVLRLVPNPNDDDRWVLSDGQRLAAYDSRWWPTEKTSYVPADPFPLSIARDDKSLRIEWDGHNTIAAIKDLSRPTILDVEDGLSFELFHFDERHIVLRVAFYWLDKSIGHKLFLVRHEVPDVERFDFIINRNTGRVILACTDLHWQESWGQLLDPDAPLETTIGLDFKTKVSLAGEGLGKLFGRTKDERPPYNPIGFIHRLAGRLAAGDQVVVKRAKGLEAHVPTLNNVGQTTIEEEERLILVSKKTYTVHEMTSTDVRKG